MRGRARPGSRRGGDTGAADLVELAVASLDHHGRGVGIADTPAATPVHVPFTMPGDRVRARVWRREPDRTLADLVDIVHPAPDRVPAACPLFGTCGGCQVQHLPYDRQVAWKARVVRELLAPLGLGDRVRPCIPSPRALGYRSKITPHHERPRAGEPLAIGFLRGGRRHDVVDVAHCPLATDAVNQALPALRAEIAAAAPGARRGATYLIRQTSSGVTTDPDARVTEQIGELRLDFFAREFFQNNPFLVPSLVAFVVDGAARDAAPVLVDAYSGSGLFALAAARRFREVIGVEVSSGAVDAARSNAATNRIPNARFVAADASRIFASVGRAGHETAVIVDPPRKGCDDAFVAQLIAFFPRTLVYVSCNPEALARDLRRLTASGFGVEVVQPFDMFPQTRHVECVSVMSREVRQAATGGALGPRA